MATTPEVGTVVWYDSKPTIVAKVGTKTLHGLVFTAFGYTTAKLDKNGLYKPVLYKGKPYPTRKMRGHLRRNKALTKSAKALRKTLLSKEESA